MVIHVEPDLWGYLEQAHATALARSYAHHLIALRNRLAPRVALAWHLSSWGTGEDFASSRPSPAHLDRLAAESAAFYESLHARFDLVFNDVADRDAGFYKVLEPNPNLLWSPPTSPATTPTSPTSRAVTHTAVVLWQLPLGNTTLNNTWGHFRDNRVQWWLGGSSHLAPAAQRATPA